MNFFSLIRLKLTKMTNTFSNILCDDNYARTCNKISRIQTKLRAKPFYTDTSSITVNLIILSLIKPLLIPKILLLESTQFSYFMIKHLPIYVKNYLLQLFNKMFSDTFSPRQWNLSIIVPILKPGKDQSNPTNYCLIYLTSCLEK